MADGSPSLPASEPRAKKSSAKPAADEPWRQLTWDDLEAWAGTRSLQRGRSYQRSSHVKQLSRTEDGGLLARVRGTHRYVTAVTTAGALESRLTCPVGTRCKHAVAVVVDYLDALKTGRASPPPARSRSRQLARERPAASAGSAAPPWPLPALAGEYREADDVPGAREGPY